MVKIRISVHLCVCVCLDSQLSQNYLLNRFKYTFLVLVLDFRIEVPEKKKEKYYIGDACYYQCPGFIILWQVYEHL